jgi:hypothetical protein
MQILRFLKNYCISRKSGRCSGLGAYGIYARVFKRIMSHMEPEKKGGGSEVNFRYDPTSSPHPHRDCVASYVDPV